MISVSSFRSFVVFKSFRMHSTKSSYENAIQKLNWLQSNKSSIEQIRKDIKTGQKCTNLDDMKNYLARTGVSLSKLDELSVIHVAGTKGKGSTSAMCEAILRRYGYRTGFYSSPHLVAVRERIRLNGKVISEEQFANYFHEVYDMLDSSKAHNGDMPKYFSFLTVLAFNVFLKEKVDVAVVEVGIGGIVDYTNVLRKVPVVAITALGLDHTSILGNSLPEIAAAKAGIIKPGCVAYTVEQPPEAMEVLRTVADSVKCPLHVVPKYGDYKYPTQKALSIDLEAYQMNASLAIQLAHSWMRLNRMNSISKSNGLKRNGFTGFPINGVKHSLITEIPSETVEGLEQCKWPGRYQVVATDDATFYMDGAHTKESMQICANWFIERNRHTDMILIFSATGDRNAEVLLLPLKKIGFKAAYFVIPSAYKEITKNSDNYSLVEQAELTSRCEHNAEIWRKFDACNNIVVLQCVSDALINIKSNYSGNTSVLITGSLHLVGAAISILDPNLCS